MVSSCPASSGCPASPEAGLYCYPPIVLLLQKPDFIAIPLFLLLENRESDFAIAIFEILLNPQVYTDFSQQPCLQESPTYPPLFSRYG